MYIEPNSTIKIYHNVPLDNTYEHTLYFASISAQNNYFHGGGNVKYTLSAQSYQRVVKGSMRVGVKADNLYDCNYLAFQNTNFGTKWFYAFITGVEYVNNETSQITFEIDDMQTYMFDVTLKDCFVEREHSATDEAGDNIQPEPVDCSNVVCADMFGAEDFDHYTAIIATSYMENGWNPTAPFTPSNQVATGGVLTGLYSGVDYLEAPLMSDADVDKLNAWLLNCDKYGKSDAIVSIFMFPSAFLPTSANKQHPVQIDKNFSKPTDIQGYIPRNKKLLTFPYNFLSVNCGNNDATYRYEWFGTDDVEFTMSCVFCCTPEIALLPVAYNNLGSSTAFNSVEKLVMNDFPQLSWKSDSYQTWLGTHHLSNAFKILGSAGAMVGGMATGSAPLAIGGEMALMGLQSEYKMAERVPPHVKGSTNGSYDVASKTKNFWFRRMQVNLDSAKVIDSFFSKFGYACNRVKKPNISSRPIWNYVKTKGCVVVGNAPADSVRHICSIYDKGITFWKNASEVGNYTDANGDLRFNSPA